MILQLWYSLMNRPAPALLQPRKTPQQARSEATIDAIHTATIQVLLAGGVGRVTTTRVAERAGVSVGSMYQYYPHKQALLFAIVERQLETIESTVRAAAERLEGCDVATVAEGLATAWLDAKTANIVSSRAIYRIAAEFDLGEVMGPAMDWLAECITTLLTAAPDAQFTDLPAVTLMFSTLLGGSVRVVMEGDPSDANLAKLRQELPVACRAYLAAANAR